MQTHYCNDYSHNRLDGGNFDVIIVGGGFSGCYLLHRLREKRFKVVVLEAASGLGGVWQWNCYPGARVDTHVPLYEYSIPEVWSTWTWTERFPTSAELRRYFEHVDTVLGLSKDVVYNTKVTAACFNDLTNIWTVKTEHGTEYRANWFIPALGFAATRLFPSWPGLENFKGEIHHSSCWPRDSTNLDKKRVAVVGTGSTGIQLVQELGPTVRELILFQRTPNLALPLRQKKLSEEEQAIDKKAYPDIHKARLQSKGGYDFNSLDLNTFDHSPEERQTLFEKQWAKGGFLLWTGTYRDALVDLKANREVYDFWSRKVREMIHDPAKRDILAPLEPPHPFGTKRPSLFLNFYDVCNQGNVRIVDIRSNPVLHVKEDGLITKDGTFHGIDVLAMATGFDAITGSFKSILIRGSGGKELMDTWRNGTLTNLGLMTTGFPNMFFMYGPQAPTALSNGPTCIEVQGDWIVETLVRHRERGIKRMEATQEGQKKYRALVNDLTNATLFPLADSYYMGANVEGKMREALNWPGGIPEYRRLLLESAENGYAGFHLA